jgi:hypothetical protein
MNYQEFMRQPSAQRASVFVEAADDRRTSPANTEKDFWLCFVLDALFTNRERSWPTMFFRGGTSLSKAFALIDRFSEDIDVAMDRGRFLPGTLSQLEKLKDDAREARLADLSRLSAQFVQDDIIPHLEAHFTKAISDTSERPRVTVSATDPLTVEITYQALTRGENTYIRSIIRLEFSIRAALVPRANKTIYPYIAGILDGATMDVEKVPTIAARRTFWDKFLIAHEIKGRFDSKENPLRADERVSRHYYDLYKLVKAKVVDTSSEQLTLARNCQRHSSLFYPTPGVDISKAVPGTYDIVPDPALRTWLERDYDQMAVMIFGPVPKFGDIISELEKFQKRVNEAGERAAEAKAAADRAAKAKSDS